MQVYFFTAGIESSELNELEARIRSRLPNLQKVARLDEVARRLGQNAAAANHEQSYIIFPMLDAESFSRIVNIVEQEHFGVFFIFISREISASDYKRLVRAGGADWVSMQGAPQEILDIISRTSRTEIRPGRDQQVRPAIVAFVPSGGGVGNATLAIETVMQIKLDKQARGRRVCLLDLDLQASHICDYLDIEPRLQIQEIIQNPDRLDAQLLDLFVSRHAASGVGGKARVLRQGPRAVPGEEAVDALVELVCGLAAELHVAHRPPAQQGLGVVVRRAQRGVAARQHPRRGQQHAEPVRPPERHPGKDAHQKLSTVT